MATLERRVSDLEGATGDDDNCKCSPAYVRVTGTRDGNDSPELCPRCGKAARVTLRLQYASGPRTADPATV